MERIIKMAKDLANQEPVVTKNSMPLGPVNMRDSDLQNDIQKLLNQEFG